MGRAGFASDKAISQRSGIAQLKFIDTQFTAFKSKATQKDLSAFYEFRNMYLTEQKFSNNQLSYIDGLYEKTMKGLGLPSYQSTYRPKKRYV